MKGAHLLPFVVLMLFPPTLAGQDVAVVAEYSIGRDQLSGWEDGLATDAMIGLGFPEDFEILLGYGQKWLQQSGACPAEGTGCVLRSHRSRDLRSVYVEARYRLGLLDRMTGFVGGRIGHTKKTGGGFDAGGINLGASVGLTISVWRDLSVQASLLRDHLDLSDPSPSFREIDFSTDRFAYRIGARIAL